ncbi:uncharacterized protein LOC129869829 [Solanum dulcamara]|uniref:uncharacterized protein LOC129869829 n=1 Tax=Solanum dulcamara TaxID=45834 RepID=UPI002486A074|nr:uncharacterized protein LOC129869829 [Solanum dulcamara]
MPPRRAPMQRGINANEDQESPFPQGNGPLPDQVTNAEFETPITMLAHVLDNQGVEAPHNAPTLSSRVRDFSRMNPPKFHGLKVDDDPQEFIDEVYKLVSIMRVTLEEKAELTTYQLKNVSQVWIGGSGCSQQGQGLGKKFVKDRVTYPKVQGEGVDASSPSFPKCAKCGNNHRGNYLMGMGACYRYGKMGHKQSKCPHVAKKGVEGLPQGGQVK